MIPEKLKSFGNITEVLDETRPAYDLEELQKKYAGTLIGDYICFFMEKNRQWKKQVVTALELAPDLDGGETKISLTGSGEAVIENYKGILQYTDSEILLQSLRGKVLLRGRNLEIVWYTSLEMKITGSIFSILLQQK